VLIPLIKYIFNSDDQNWSCGLAARPRLGLQEQDQTNTEATRPRPSLQDPCSFAHIFITVSRFH